MYGNIIHKIGVCLKRFLHKIGVSNLRKLHKIGVSFSQKLHKIGVYVSGVYEDSPAEAAGMRAGDQLIRIADTDITHYDMVSTTVQAHLDEEIPVTVKRNGEIYELSVTPLSNPPEGRGAMGVVITYAVNDIGFFESIKAGFEDTVYMTKSYVEGLGMLFSGQIDMGLESIVGPVGMYSYFSEAAEIDMERTAEIQEHQAELEAAGVSSDIRTASSTSGGWTTRLSFFALISVALGVTNLFPIPGLDGGRILFLLPELLFKKKIPLKVETAANSVCMALLMGLMMVVLFKDIFVLVR